MMTIRLRKLACNGVHFKNHNLDDRLMTDAGMQWCTFKNHNLDDRLMNDAGMQ